jgi:hypothetical protein
VLKIKKYLSGYSYIEIIIAMALFSILTMQIANQINIITKNYIFSQDSYFANLAAENLLNIVLYDIEQNNSLSKNLYSDNELFYDSKFNFSIQINKIMQNYLIDTQNHIAEINNSHEEIPNIQTEISCNNINLFQDINTQQSNSILITINIFNKHHKLIKKITSIK